jgi:hypothetical protein
MVKYTSENEGRRANRTSLCAALCAARSLAGGRSSATRARSQPVERLCGGTTAISGLFGGVGRVSGSGNCVSFPSWRVHPVDALRM